MKVRGPLIPRDTGVLSTKLAQTFSDNLYLNVHPPDHHTKAYSSLDNLLFVKNLFISVSMPLSSTFSKLYATYKEAESFIYMQIVNMDTFFNLLCDAHSKTYFESFWGELFSDLYKQFYNLFYLSRYTLLMVPRFDRFFSMYSMLQSNYEETDDPLYSYLSQYQSFHRIKHLDSTRISILTISSTIFSRIVFINTFLSIS